MRKSALKLLIAALLAYALVSLESCTGGRSLSALSVHTGGVASRGSQLISIKNCGSCHTIPGIPGARGVVGPPLNFFARRTMIAGELPNTPDNLTHWVQAPQSVLPGNAMPDLGLTEEQARDVAAYLYTLQ
jgi:cytochrome c2